MRTLTATIAAIAALMATASASAQDDIDLRGTWAGTTEAIALEPGDYYETRKLDAEFMEVPVEVVIDQQKGRRFAGTITSRRWHKPFVGVLAGEGRFLWAEPGGTVEGRLVDADTLDYCYLRAGQGYRI